MHTARVPRLSPRCCINRCHPSLTAQCRTVWNELYGLILPEFRAFRKHLDKRSMGSCLCASAPDDVTLVKNKEKNLKRKIETEGQELSLVAACSRTRGRGTR